MNRLRSAIGCSSWVAGVSLFTALGCGGSVSDGAKAGGSAASGQDAGSASSPCAQYYAAQYTRCGGPTLPAAEAARVQARFEQSCEDEAALPGSGMTAAALTTCASALAEYACESPATLPNECSFRGTLSGGAACTEGVQCASGACQGTVSFSPEGPTGPFTCGTCADLVAVGQDCGNGGCGANAICMTLDTTAKVPTYDCTALTEGPLGATCDGLTALCEPGLYCSTQTKECTKLGGVGATCGEQQGQSFYPGGCEPPLGCVSYSCAAGPAGAFCQSDAVCNAGLGCVAAQGSGTPSGVCTPTTWASAGEACDGALVRCLVGSCNFGSFIPVVLPDGGAPSGTCPSVIADGQACTVTDSSTTCDTFSECFEGKCGLSGSGVCN